MMIKQLPPGSPLHRATDPNGWSWGTTDELLAMLAELVDMGNRLFIQANSKKGSRQPKPLEITRPWQSEEPPQQQTHRHATADEIRTFFKR